MRALARTLALVTTSVRHLIMDQSAKAVWWTRDAKERLMAELVRLGLTSCSTCGSDLLLPLPRPAMIPTGGPSSTDADVNRATGVGVIIAMLVRCEVCGHLLLYDHGALEASTTEDLTFQRPD